MHLFGDAHEPHLTHFEVEREPGFVMLRWDVRNAPALRWRVLRSDHDFADEAADSVDGGQTLVSESVQCGAADENVDARTTYFYTVFAQDQEGTWHGQVKAKVKPAERLHWHHPAYDAESVPQASESCGEVVQDAPDPSLMMWHRGPDVIR